MASSSTRRGLCPDWVLSTEANVHVTRNRAWYTTYTPFPTFAMTSIGGDRHRVSVWGIGDVDITVQLYSEYRDGRAAHGMLRLRNGLHIPAAKCNIVGGPQTGDYSGLQRGYMYRGEAGIEGEITGRDGQRLAALRAVGEFSALKLRRPPFGRIVGESTFNQGDPGWVFDVHWTEWEQRRWARESHLYPPDPPLGQLDAWEKGSQGGATSAPYTQKEKDWLKRNWDDEFTFLAANALSIYKEEDRELGRRIARQMMSIDSGEGIGRVEHEDEDEDEVEGKSSEREIQNHVADHHFTTKELGYINKEFRSSEMFMITYGLKFYKDEDCEEAKALVKALMAPDDDDSD
ncbi:hypothetical protein C8A01DRAFT_19839 [Parachaetomium inaequale]|uniref:Retrovirus-related Pol polyprotein from transposon TNT 1-94-like beta-barrel domain-containing protein n=1 Tax=Parachaetomium inaequale TaxID=2588326 RepID=A0AAN6SMV7_9PEZI|nr:hypothetical protein C8A01DRAFT_19839 [Parachaetomium inaequale]